MSATHREKPKGLLGRWNATPLYLRIVAAMAFAVPVGRLLGKRAAILEISSTVILQLLGALAPPLILIAVTHVLMTSTIRGRTAARLAGLLLLNTTVAILIGLMVANVLSPSSWSELRPAVRPEAATDEVDPVQILLQNVPRSILGPLGDRQNVIGVIIIAVDFGVALRGVQQKPVTNVRELVEVAYEVLLTVLHWIIQLVPIGVFAIVARVVGTEGFGPFKAAILYVVRSGCQGRRLLRNFPNSSTVDGVFGRWRLAGLWRMIHDALRELVQRAEGKKAALTATILDRQSFRTAAGGEERGSDADKQLTGRKRRLAALSGQAPPLARISLGELIGALSGAENIGRGATLILESGSSGRGNN